MNALHIFYYAITERGQIAGAQTIDADESYLTAFNEENGVFQPLLVNLNDEINAVIEEEERAELAERKRLEDELAERKRLENELAERKRLENEQAERERLKVAIAVDESGGDFII